MYLYDGESLAFLAISSARRRKKIHSSGDMSVRQRTCCELERTSTLSMIKNKGKKESRSKFVLGSLFNT